MSWESFYLICFLVGLALSVLSLLAGVGKIHLSSRWHIPGANAHHAASGVHVHTGGGRPSVKGAQRVSFFNFSSIMAFLAWFGGTGYLLTRYSSLWTVVAFGVAMASGLVAAAIVSLFLIKVLLAHDSALDPADFELVGVLGTVIVGIRQGGTGELVFSQSGSRHVIGARSENGQAIAKGTEVVVTRYDKGIAYVRGWEEMAGEGGSPERMGETSKA
jgi:membrane protein implicated in regulation of membrane protease activity